jgi:hypothetical protein
MSYQALITTPHQHAAFANSSLHSPALQSRRATPTQPTVTNLSDRTAAFHVLSYGKYRRQYHGL